MAEEKPSKAAAKPAPAKAPETGGVPVGEGDLKESVAEAPGPITPEHESGSWEQTLREQEAREELRKAQRGESSE